MAADLPPRLSRGHYIHENTRIREHASTQGGEMNLEHAESVVAVLWFRAFVLS